MRRDRWVVRDGAGVLHDALVLRWFDEVGALVLFQVVTACVPGTRQHQPARGWTSPTMPDARHGDFTIVEWRVREAPTCLRCVAVPGIGFE